MYSAALSLPPTMDSSLLLDEEFDLLHVTSLNESNDYTFAGEGLTWADEFDLGVVSF